MAGLWARCRIPDGEHHRPTWQLALEMLDELAALGLRPGALVADTGHGANANFRRALEERALACSPRLPGHRSRQTLRCETIASVCSRHIAITPTGSSPAARRKSPDAKDDRHAERHQS
ncbi:transposase [Streptomyces bobili]|uniref:transposase n=1 Tax=Streptomyces bobili TaxID=67280 RepID=UPI0033B84BB4